MSEKNIIKGNYQQGIKISLWAIFVFISVAISGFGFKENFNTASAEDLDKIKGVGIVKSASIVTEREINGDFKSKEDFVIRMSDKENGKVGEIVTDRLFQKYTVKE